MQRVMVSRRITGAIGAEKAFRRMAKGNPDAGQGKSAARCANLHLRLAFSCARAGYTTIGARHLRFALVAVAFPKFTEGAAYSLAHTLAAFLALVG